MNQELIERWQTEFETADAETVRLMLAEAPELVVLHLPEGVRKCRRGNLGWRTREEDLRGERHYRTLHSWSFVRFATLEEEDGYIDRLNLEDYH